MQGFVNSELRMAIFPPFLLLRLQRRCMGLKAMKWIERMAVDDGREDVVQDADLGDGEIRKRDWADFTSPTTIALYLRLLRTRHLMTPYFRAYLHA